MNTTQQLRRGALAALSKVSAARFAVIRALGLTPMQSVLRRVEEWGWRLSDMDAIEMFAGKEYYQTQDFAGRVRSVTAWDADHNYARELRENLPMATVECPVDSFKAAKTHSRRYDLITIDAPLNCYHGYCEHHELFTQNPSVFRLAKDRAVFVITVATKPSIHQQMTRPSAFTDEHVARRAAFYKPKRAGHVTRDEMLAAYGYHAAGAGYTIKRHHWEPRMSYMEYLALEVERT